MPIRRPDSRQIGSEPAGERSEGSSPETFPSRHQSRLCMPRDWRGAMKGNRRSSDSRGSGGGGGGGASGSNIKDQRQSLSEIDVENPDPDPESLVMSLLCSIIQASANAVPEIRSPSLQSRLRPRDQQRPRPTSVSSRGSGGGGGPAAAVSSSSNDYYRLPWYRRPLPLKQRMSSGSSNGDSASKRRNSGLGAPRSGVKPPRRSTGSAAALNSSASAAVTPATDRGSLRASGRLQEQKKDRPPSQDRESAKRGCCVTLDKASAPELSALAGATSPPSPVCPSSPALEVEAGSRLSSEQESSGGLSLSTAEDAPSPSEADDKPVANSISAGWGVAAEGEGSLKRGKCDVGVAAAVSSKLEFMPPGEEDAGCDEVQNLNAEVRRLKQEIASMAAALPRDTTASPATVQTKRNRGVQVTQPSLASARGSPSTWGWGPSAVGSEGSRGDAGEITHPFSARVRADDSWVHRRSSSSGGGGRGGAASNANGFFSRARVGSVLPARGGGGSSSDRARERSPSEDGGRGPGEQEGLLLSPPPSCPKVAEGPSPASRDKNEDAQAAAAAIAGERRRQSGESEGGDGSSGRTRRNTSKLQLPVFFPVQPQQKQQEQSREPAPALPAAVQAAAAAASSGGSGGCRGAAADGFAAAEDVTDLALAAATGMGVAASAPEAARAAQAGGDAVCTRQELSMAPKQSASSPVAGLAQARRVAATGGVGAEAVNCPRNAGEGCGGLWRWVLAQRTGNPTVRQALLSHGLPQRKRRHIWAAWASVASPEACRKARALPDPAQEGSVASVIAHDVARTKMSHLLFENGGQGLAILKRVLHRCTGLGAVKEAGYIQGMNYLAAFLLITLTDCVSSERCGHPATRSRKAGAIMGSSSCTTPVAPAPAWATSGEVTPRHDLRAPPANEVGVGVESTQGWAVVADASGPDGGAADSGGAGPTEAELGVIESECVQMMEGIIALQGGVLSRNLWGLHETTELVEDLLSRYCPDVMEHLRMVNLELIVLTPRWFICIFAGSIASQAVVTRIWDLYLWYGRRGPAILVWVALSVLNGCRRRMIESKGLPATVKAIRRHAESCRTFDDLVRQAPVALNQVVDAWERQANNRRIAALDGEEAVQDRMAAELVGEMTGEPVCLPPQEAWNSPPDDRHARDGAAPIATATTSSGFGIQFPSTPGRSPKPMASPKSPFPDWAANIFRSSTGGAGVPVEHGLGRSASSYADKRREVGRDASEDLPPTSPRYSTRQLRRSTTTSWW